MPTVVNYKIIHAYDKLGKGWYNSAALCRKNSALCMDKLCMDNKSIKWDWI